MSSARPRPIDPRGPRFNQAVLTVALLAAFVLGATWVVPVFAVVLLLGAAFGPRWGPFLRLYAVAIKPRLAPPKALEDPRPPRFAATVGVAFLAAGTLAFGLGATTVGWVLALIVAALAGLAATTGICIGCEIYLLAVRRRGRQLVA
jgi:4-hydroxybenzoate polyprenyltransferase